MIRRNTRLRREYLYRKSLEGKEREKYEKKRMISKALEEGRAIPSELAEDALILQKEMEFDDVRSENHLLDIDSEYLSAGVDDPKLVITTSRNPSSRLSMFVKELRLTIPNTTKLNRGKYVLKDLVDTARGNNFSDLIIVHEHRGEPDAMIVCHLPYGPTAYFGLHNCVLRHDVQLKKTISESYPHILFHNFSTKLGNRFETILKHTYPSPKEQSKRVVTYANQNNFISFRHHLYKKKGHKDVELEELGPRFEMKPYQITLGTVDQKDAQKEWVLRPYMNTAKQINTI